MPVKAYGEWVASNLPIPTAHADRVLGCLLVSDKSGRPEFVEVQYQTADAEYPFAQVRFEFLNAMFLLTCLRAIQLETGTKMPDGSNL